MCFSRVLFGILVTILVTDSVGAPPINDVTVSEGSPAIISYDTWINANRVLGFMSNNGTVFTDNAVHFGKTDGFYYPYTSIDDIWSGQHDKTCVYSAGLWLGGRVGGQIRLALAEYNSEYGPGPYGWWPSGEVNPACRVYRLYADSLANNPNEDYLNWPIDQGAPVTSEGAPAMLGDEMLWTVFNDASPSLHNNNAGSTLPLGIEIRMTMWSSSELGSHLGDQVYARYLLYNKGGNQIDSFYMAFWVDPDLGNAGDDLVGCDTLNDVFFCYNGTAYDQLYGANPPAWGGQVISGPVVPSLGDTATFDGRPLADHRNLRMSSFMAYVNGTDPTSPTQTYRCLQGLLRDGTPYIPDLGPCKYMYAGDPVLMRGDLDTHPGDRRLLVSFGPLSCASGDSQQVVLRIGARQANQNLLAIERLKSTLLDQEETCCINPVGDLDCSLSQIADIADITVLIDHLFISRAALCCPGEGECDAIPGIDIGDIEVLANSLFVNFEPLPRCP